MTDVFHDEEQAYLEAEGNGSAAEAEALKDDFTVEGVLIPVEELEALAKAAEADARYMERTKAARECLLKITANYPNFGLLSGTMKPILEAMEAYRNEGLEAVFNWANSRSIALALSSSDLGDMDELIKKLAELKPQP